MAECNLYC